MATLLFYYYRQHRLFIIVAWLLNTCGSRIHPNDGSVVLNFIPQALHSQHFTEYTDSQHMRLFSYVDDLIEVFLRLMSAQDEVSWQIILGNTVDLALLQLVQKVIEITGYRSGIQFRPLPLDDQVQYQLNISLVEEALGCRSHVKFGHGLTFDHQLIRPAAQQVVTLVFGARLA